MPGAFRTLFVSVVAPRLTLLIGKGALIALLYYLLVVIGMKLHFSTSGLSLIWPSNALLAATLVLSPKGRWWFYLLATIPAHIAAMSSYNLDLWWLAYQVAFNSALTATFAAILQRFKPEILYFEALRDVLIFLGVSVAVPVLLNWVAIYPIFKFSSTSSALLAHNSSAGFFAVWTSCWINNSASFMAFVPTILVCATRGRSWFRDFSPATSWRGSTPDTALHRGYIPCIWTRRHERPNVGSPLPHSDTVLAVGGGSIWSNRGKSIRDGARLYFKLVRICWRGTLPTLLLHRPGHLCADWLDHDLCSSPCSRRRRPRTQVRHIGLFEERRSIQTILRDPAGMLLHDFSWGYRSGHQFGRM